jgi:hypothetical protein
MQLADYLKTLAAAGVVLAVTLPRGTGFVLLLLLPLLLLTLIYQAVRMLRQPQERKARATRLAIWCLAFALAGSVQSYRAAATRSHAEQVVQTVLAHQKRTGAYPSSLTEAGLDQDLVRRRWRVGYLVRDGQPLVSYPAPFMPLTVYEYDLAAGGWRRNAH